MTRFDVTAFGESMLRMSVSIGQRLELATQLDVHPAGAETNVLAALSQMGRRCGWLSALPDNPLGRLIANQFRMRGIDLSGVLWAQSGRVGTYFIEMAAPPRVTQVIYDRANSCVSQLTPDQVDWDYLLDSRLLHLTGITPALSAGCQTIVREAISRAHAAGIPVSFDINYRQKLWSAADAADVLLPLLERVTLLFCPLADAHLLFGTTGTAENVIKQLAARTYIKHIILSVGEDSVVAWDGTRIYRQPAHETMIIDPIGAGDALAAGVIHGWLAGDFVRGLQIGVALAALVLGQFGDMVVVAPTELDALLNKRQRGISR